MTIRTTSTPVLLALVLSVAVTPILSEAQTPAPADASTNATPAPAPAPAPAAPTTPAPAAPSDTTSTERPSTYTVAQGDSLWTIAHKFGTTVVKLRNANKLKKHALLHPGQVLQIPPATDAST